MRVKLARGVPCSCSALALLGSLLACTRAGSVEPCGEGQECAEQSGWAIPSSPGGLPQATPADDGCGDGILDPEREECDDGSACRDGRDCTEEPARCQVGGGERSCAPRSGDGCSAECRVEPGYECPEQGPCRRLPEPPPLSEMPPDLELSPAPAPSGSTGSGALGGAGSPGMSEPDPPVVPCELAPFREPERVQGLEPRGVAPGAVQLWAPALSSDGSTLYFAAAQPGVPERLFAATRSHRDGRFNEGAAVTGLDSGAGDGTPLISHDGLRLYFYSRRPGGSGDRDLWLAVRPDPDADFAAPTLLAGVNSPALEHLPWLSADELTLVFVSTRAGGLGQSDLWLARRAQPNESFSTPELLRALSGSADEGRAVLSSSGNSVIFASARAGGQGLQDLWLARRADGAADFEAPTPLSELNSAAMDLDPFLTLDDRELFFVSDRGGRAEIWRAQRDCAE